MLFFSSLHKPFELVLILVIYVVICDSSERLIDIFREEREEKFRINDAISNPRWRPRSRAMGSRSLPTWCLIFMSTSTFPYLQLSFILSTSLICGRADSESPLSLQSCNKLRLPRLREDAVYDEAVHFQSFSSCGNLIFKKSARQTAEK